MTHEDLVSLVEELRDRLETVENDLSAAESRIRDLETTVDDLAH